MKLEISISIFLPDTELTAVYSYSAEKTYQGLWLSFYPFRYYNINQYQYNINIWGCTMIDGERLRDLATCIKSINMCYLDEWILMQLLSAECIEWILDDVINTCRAFLGPQTLWSQKYRENWWVGIFIYIFWHLFLLTTFTQYFKGFLCTLKIKHNNWELGVECVWHLLYMNGLISGNHQERPRCLWPGWRRPSFAGAFITN